MNKQELSERDICTKYIVPALERVGWDRMLQMREEFEIARGRIIVLSDRRAEHSRWLMKIRPIKNETDYRATLMEIEALMSAEMDSPEGDRLDALVTLVEAFERKFLTANCLASWPHPAYLARHGGNVFKQ